MKNMHEYKMHYEILDCIQVRNLKDIILDSKGFTQ